jgi:pyridoxine/pyridoxamine 5'-phosphate oxidase
MVSKAKSIGGSVESLNYIQDDKSLGGAVELDRNGLAGESSEEMLQEMRFVQANNQNCNKNCISIVLSPSEEKKFTMEELKKLTRDHLKNLGLENHQYLATVHNSTGTPHIHIVANRIDHRGIALNDSFISKKAQDSAEKLAIDRGLKTAKERSIEIAIEVAPIKKQMLHAYQHAKYSTKTFDEFKEKMKSQGISVAETINKQGELQGMKFTHEKTGKEFKASEIQKGVGAPDMSRSGIKFDLPLANSGGLKVGQGKTLSKGIATKTPLIPSLPTPFGVAQKVVKIAIDKGRDRGQGY